MSTTPNTTDLNTFLQQKTTSKSAGIAENEASVLEHAGIEMLDLDAPEAMPSSQEMSSYTSEQKSKELLQEVSSAPASSVSIPKIAPVVMSASTPRFVQPIESADDLRAAFTDTLSKSMPHDSLSMGGIEAEKSELLILLDKIRNKLTSKKIHIKDMLDALKKDKEEIATLIEEVKELEDTETKIQDKVQKLSLLEQEIDSLQDEARAELR
jgi:Mg2+ and Co2+ transporter CorA